LKKRFLIYIIIFILIGSGLLLLITRKEKKEEKAPPVIKKRVEPSFKKEGYLSFMDDVSGDTLAVIDIEIVEQQEEIRQGLMYRSHLEEDNGMFFIFPEEEEQSFWMKNTMIQLDIIFVNADFRIVHITRYAMPYSKEPIPSIYPSKYVVEVNGGFCDSHHIEPGDQVIYDVIN
jgi:hypothetical protein